MPGAVVGVSGSVRFPEFAAAAAAAMAATGVATFAVPGFGFGAAVPGGRPGPGGGLATITLGGAPGNGSLATTTGGLGPATAPAGAGAVAGAGGLAAAGVPAAATAAALGGRGAAGGRGGLATGLAVPGGATIGFKLPAQAGKFSALISGTMGRPGGASIAGRGAGG